MLDRDRLIIAEEQRRLLLALLTANDLPDGFNSHRIYQASQALMRKRRRLMQRANPAVDNILQSEQGHACFLRFCRDQPSVAPAGPYDDSRRFLEHRRKEEQFLSGVNPIIDALRFIIGQCKSG